MYFGYVCYISSSIMGVNRRESGFTVAEMVVALVVMSIFMTLFFQLYMTSESQRIAVVRRAAANDIAMTNLQKIPAKAAIPGTTTPCQSGGGSVNNLVDNPSAVGSTVAWSATLAAEVQTGTSLPPSTTQVLTVFYPSGCGSTMPAKIVSTVTYGSETVSRAAFVN